MLAQVLVFTAVFLAVYGLYLEFTRPRRRLQVILDRSESLRSGRLDSDANGLVKSVAQLILPRLRPWLPALTVDQLRWRLLWAGRPGGLSAEEFYFLKLAVALGLGVAVPLLTLFQGEGTFGKALMLGAVGYLLPDLWLKQRITQREIAIQTDLPMIVGTLATALEAGLPLTEAVRQVARESPGLLSAELMRTVQEIAAGKPVQQAWRSLMDRTTAKDLKSVVNGILQGHEYGVPVAEQLRLQMKQVRQEKRQRAHQRNQAALVQMRVPMVLLILVPTMFIVLGPGVLLLMQQLQGGMP